MMMSPTLRFLVPGLLLPLFMGNTGGWAVITVDHLPDAVEVGKAVALSYTVRQHGENPIDQLHGRVEAKSGRLSATGIVRANAKRGHYTALLTLPSAGDWTITIRSGFGKSDVTLLPVTAVASAAGLTRTVSDADRGERLFVAKGCVTCHRQIPVGPKLDGKRFDATFLAGYLANPPAPSAGKPAMPNLGLQQREIASLVAYLNGNRQVGSR
jgi:mono/diheme cytochrome c family protein